MMDIFNSLKSGILNPLLLFTVLEIHCYSLQCWKSIVIVYNVGNPLLLFTMLGIHCYCLQYKEYIVIVYSVGNTLLLFTV